MVSSYAFRWAMYQSNWLRRPFGDHGFRHCLSFDDHTFDPPDCGHTFYYLSKISCSSYPYDLLGSALGRCWIFLVQVKDSVHACNDTRFLCDICRISKRICKHLLVRVPSLPFFQELQMDQEEVEPYHLLLPYQYQALLPPCYPTVVVVESRRRMLEHALPVGET